MRLDKHLPPNAIQIRYIHPYFEGVYDDEDNFVEEYCTNEDTATDVYDLIRKAHREKQSYYYRRRTQDLCTDDVRQYRAWTDTQHANNPKPFYNIKVRKLGRRVVIEYNPDYAFKMWKSQNDRLKNANKPRHSKPKFPYPNLSTEERVRRSIEDMFQDLDTSLLPTYERNEHE